MQHYQMFFQLFKGLHTAACNISVELYWLLLLLDILKVVYRQVKPFNMHN